MEQKKSARFFFKLWRPLIENKGHATSYIILVKFGLLKHARKQSYTVSTSDGNPTDQLTSGARH